jgi:hypothetical protein
LRHFADRFSEGEYREKRGDFYLDAIRDMQNTTLVQWSPAAHGYTLDRVVRRIMSQNLAVRRPEEFHRRHGAAVRLNNAWIDQYPRNAVSYLIERTFHRYWELCAARDSSECEQTLVDEFAELLEQIKNKPDVQWDLPDMAVALQEELAQDDEFPELLSADTCDRLKALADQFHEDIRVSWP